MSAASRDSLFLLSHVVSAIIAVVWPVARSCRLTLVTALAIGCMSTAVAAASAKHVAQVHVPCSNIIGNETTHEDKTAGLRLLLGTVFTSLGPLQKATPVLAYQRWRYWMKQGVDIRAGAGPPVEISLPRSWDKKARLTWGNGLPRGTTIEFARCGPKSRGWNGYAGGFYINSRSACVPLHIRVGRATASVTVAIGRRCE